MRVNRREFIATSTGLIVSGCADRCFGRYVKEGTMVNGVVLPYRSAEGDAHVHTILSNGGQFGDLDYDHANAPTLSEILHDCDYHGPWLYILSDHGEQMTAKNWMETGRRLIQMPKQYPVYRAFEWTLGGAINNPNCCHIVVMATDQYAATHPAPADFGGDVVTSYHDLWGWLEKNLGRSGMWGFPHPWIGKYQFDDFALAPQQTVRDRCCWIEVCGGPTHRSIKDGIPFFVRAVEKGWHVGPVTGSDNFGKIDRTPPVTGVPLIGSPKNRDQMMGCILRRQLFVSDVVLSYFTWSMMKSGVPQSEVLLGGTYDARQYGFPDTVDFMVNQIYYPRLARWEMYFVNGKNPFAQGRAPDDPPGAILKYQERATPRPTAVILCLILQGGERILGAPIWLKY